MIKDNEYIMCFTYKCYKVSFKSTILLTDKRANVQAENKPEKTHYVSSHINKAKSVKSSGSQRSTNPRINGPDRLNNG